MEKPVKRQSDIEADYCRIEMNNIMHAYTILIPVCQCVCLFV
jgi:hypothetical protein